jgi:hypothetical protein
MMKKSFPRFFIALFGYDGERFVVLMSDFGLEEKKIW